MSNLRLCFAPIGSIVKLKMNGAYKNFVVVNQGRPSDLYDASCDGTWLMIQDCLESRPWNSTSASNDYSVTSTNNYLNSDAFLAQFEPDIRAVIKTVKIPYRSGSGWGTAVSNGANGLSVRAFLLSALEVGLTASDLSGTLGFPEDGAKLAYFESGSSSSAKSKRIARLNGSAAVWGLRSSECNTSGSSLPSFNPAGAWIINTAGVLQTSAVSNPRGIRFAMVLPSNLSVDDDGVLHVNTAPSEPRNLTVPSQINGGSTITIHWFPASDDEDNLEGYKLERSTDGGSTWSQVYQGSAIITTNIVQFGTQSVMYRVRAYDSEGLHSGYKTSGQVTVINNTAPTVPGGIIVPEAVQGGQPLTVSWGASSDGENNLAGYALERQVDGGDWTAVYSGDQLGFTDAITKGWQTVAYRVRAYDTASAYSGFTTSETRTVNNNTPPVITWDYAQDQNLGVKREGFALAYSVSDEEGDAVSVTEAADGKAWRTFAVQLGAANSLQVQGLDFMRLLNGRHVLSITASDGAASAVRRVAFTKEVTKASVTLAAPMEADGPISVCVLSVSGFIPADAAYKIEVTNNAKDAAPAWEDCTAEARNGTNYIFDNQTAANGFAFNFRLSAERGAGGAGGYIKSVQGGFQ